MPALAPRPSRLPQVRLLSVSPTPSMDAAQLLRLTGLSYLAGLEVKLYSDVPHHEAMIESAPATHASLQVGGGTPHTHLPSHHAATGSLSVRPVLILLPLSVLPSCRPEVCAALSRGRL